MKYVLLNDEHTVCVTLDKFPDGPFTESDRDRFLEAPNEVGDRWRFFDNHWHPPAEIPLPPFKKVSPVEFKLLFTSQERVAINAARAADPVIDDFFDIVDDPRLTHVDLGLQSTQDALSYLVAKSLLTEDRKSEILRGEVQ